jgi:hypothetical protein
MVAEFLARGGQITVFGPAHALPVNNGGWRDADRWVV